MDSTQARLFGDQLLAGGTLAGWTLIEVVGAGKSAVVFKAERAGKTAALKVFHPEIIDRFGLEAQKTRIERERALIGTNHAHLVDIVDGGACEELGHLYVAMEFVDGKILSEVLNEIPRQAIDAVVEQLARAAKHLEDLGLVHRDIKPDNIMVTTIEPVQIKLLDFGVLKPIGGSSVTNQPGYTPFVGTHQYSPPEMAHDRVDESIEGWRAVTFYQIGAVLHDLLMRKRIFEDCCQPIGNLINAIDSNYPKIDAPDASGELTALAKRCLHLKKPEDRARLISWSDFWFSERSSSADIQLRRERLFKRQQTAAIHKKRDPLERIERARLDRHRVEVAVQHLRQQLDSVLDSYADHMPPRTVRVENSVFPDPAVHCSYPADRKLYSSPFHLQITVQFVDPQSNVIDIHVRAGKGEVGQEIGWTHLGGFVEDLEGLPPILENWLFEILEEMVDE